VLQRFGDLGVHGDHNIILQGIHLQRVKLQVLALVGSDKMYRSQDRVLSGLALAEPALHWSR
jgi:hypothetical protein